MNADFDRFFRLAKKTGDTLIIFDAQEGNHQVIMDIDRYEDLVMNEDFFSGTDFGEELPVGQKQTEVAQDQFMPEFPDSTAPKEKQWHAAGDVLDNLYPEFNVAPSGSEDLLGKASFDSDEEIQLNFEPVESALFTAESADMPLAPKDIEYDPVLEEPKPIPEATETEREVDQYNEESLGDEPIFFEEPLA